MSEICQFGRVFDPKHTTCRTCPVSCKKRLELTQEQHKSKYGNKKVVVDGIVFDSKREAVHYYRLKLMEKSGLITDLELQPEFEIIPKIGKQRATKYRADFAYIQGGEKKIVDVKGMKTVVYRLKKKLMKHVHNIDIVEV
jgi:CxxC motif-containing protein